MKRLVPWTVLLISLMTLLLSLSLHLHSSVISPQSPWGVVAVWARWGGPCGYHADSVSRWREWYTPKLDSMKSCGLSWVRANCCGVGIKTENGDTFFYYDALDSLVIFVQEYDLNLIGGGWPPDWSPDSWLDSLTVHQGKKGR